MRTWNSTLQRHVPLKKTRIDRGNSSFDRTTVLKRKRRERDGREAFLDEMFYRLIRIPGQCAMCGVTIREVRRRWGAEHDLEVHHLIHKGMGGRKTWRWHPMDGLLLCLQCHQHAENAPHVNRGAFLEWLKRERAEQHAWYLEHVNLTGRPDYDQAELLLREALECAATRTVLSVVAIHGSVQAAPSCS